MVSRTPITSQKLCLTYLLSISFIRLCEVMHLNPIPVIMAIILHANIGGILTPIGDPVSVVITSHQYVAKHVGKIHQFFFSWFCFSINFNFNFTISSLGSYISFVHCSCNRGCHIRFHTNWHSFTVQISWHSRPQIQRVKESERTSSRNNCMEAGCGQAFIVVERCWFGARNVAEKSENLKASAEESWTVGNRFEGRI